MSAGQPLPSCSVSDLEIFELAVGDASLLQRFFEDNPEYFLAVNGGPPGADEARDQFEDKVPAGMSYSRQWLLGWRERAGSLAAMASVVSDLLAPRVWHIGLFILASARHGSGQAQSLYRDIESWARDCGAIWIRLGVVQGNTRAERFWESLGFLELRKRAGVVTGRRTSTLRVMCKPLAGASLETYLGRVPRDRPGNADSA